MLISRKMAPCARQFYETLKDQDNRKKKKTLRKIGEQVFNILK